MILPCWGETALVKKRLPSRKCVYFVLKEASLLGVGSFHWTSLLSIRILQDSWYVDIIPLLNLKKSAHSQSPALIFFWGGFDAHPNRESLKSGNFSGLPGMDSETFRTFLPWTKPGARNQTWGGCFLMSELVFFFRWFFSPCQVLSPNFFGCLLFDKGVITIQKKVNKSTKKKHFQHSTEPNHWWRAFTIWILLLVGIGCST